MALTKKIDLPPGSLVYVGDRTALEMDLSVITFDAASARINHLSKIDELPPYKDGSTTAWINITGLKDIDSIKRLGELFNIHPLSIEDILHTDQQPKIEIFEEYRFFSFKTIQRNSDFHHNRKKKKSFPWFPQKRDEAAEGIEEFIIDQTSIIFMKNTLITFEEVPGRALESVRKRILGGLGEIRKMGADYLIYAVIDAVVDEYSSTLNHLEEDIEDFEDRATKTDDDTYIEEIQNTKKYLFRIKRAIYPLKESIVVITRHVGFFQTDELKPFLQDLNENLNNAMVMVENHREWLTNIMDVNFSVLSQQMNRVMKVLAIISTIFIPLTFIAGIYGMNFYFMPELAYKFGYPLVLGVMGIIAVIMIIFFKIRRWF